MNVLLITYDIRGADAADEKNRAGTLNIIKRLAGNEDNYFRLSECAYTLKTGDDAYTVWCEFMDVIDYKTGDKVWVATLSKPFVGPAAHRDWLMKNISIGEDAEEIL